MSASELDASKPYPLSVVIEVVAVAVFALPSSTDPPLAAPAELRARQWAATPALPAAPRMVPVSPNSTGSLRGLPLPPASSPGLARSHSRP